jgi:ABC-type uncharacterized transport system fused permease/ATPase subunit
MSDVRPIRNAAHTLTVDVATVATGAVLAGCGTGETAPTGSATLSTVMTAAPQSNPAVHSGEFVAVTGPSRSGKSTPLACLAGMDNPEGSAPTSTTRSELVYLAHSETYTFKPNR